MTIEIGGILIVMQIVLLVLYYGNILPMLPWWVVWMPGMILGTAIVASLLFAAIILVVAIFIAIING